MRNSNDNGGRSDSIYIVWKKYQRRVESLAPEFGASINYYHYHWEERSGLHKLVSYGLKFVKTFMDLLRQRPSRVFVQLAPTPALYVVAAYASISGAVYIADCHNSMIYGSWIRWPLARRLLRHSEQMLVHNKDVAEQAELKGLRPFVLRTPLPMIDLRNPQKHLSHFGLDVQSYVIVPGNLAQDEPVQEIIDAARQLPSMIFVFTWFADRLPKKVRDAAPGNVMFSGYLTPDEFNAVFAHAAAAVVLTTREGTQPSGAAEAVMLEVPLVLSDLQTTRRMNGPAAIYVINNESSIAMGVDIAIRERKSIQRNMRELRRSAIMEMGTQLLALKGELSMRCEINYLKYMHEVIGTMDVPIGYRAA